MIKHCFILLCSFLLLKDGYAQIGSIKGSVKAPGRQAGLLISLVHAKDSSFAKTTLADDNGKFEFEMLKEGSYKVVIAQSGLQQYSSAIIVILPQQPQMQLEPIVLNEVAANLQEVKVVSKKPFIEKKIDRVVVNPDALIGNAGATSLEVLEKAPGVLVDINGNISLKGKPGVLVFIDDKPTYLSAADLAGYLRSLPGGSIESIEIMPNPPARYDAAGNAGVINIRLKKNKVKGINGALNLSYGQGKYHRTNNSFNINYRVNKFNFFGNAGISDNNSYQDLTITRQYFEPGGAFSSGFKQNSYIKKRAAKL